MDDAVGIRDAIPLVMAFVADVHSCQRPLIRVCAWCQDILEPSLRAPISKRSRITHAICPSCVRRYFADPNLTDASPIAYGVSHLDASSSGAPQCNAHGASIR